MDIFKFSKLGDRGQTSLLTGERVSKSSLRPETYGTLDEASSALGMAKALSKDQKLRGMITLVQEDLLVLGAELSCESPSPAHQIGVDRIERLEQWIVDLQREAPLPRKFILPGESTTGAALDIARTITRRAERRAVEMNEAGLIDRPEVHSYLNRLADLLFTLARYADQHN